MYEAHKGKIPKGLIVCHKCDNKMCINPDHLFVGTQADNMRDMCEKGRKFITNGEVNGQSKLTEEQVIEIRSIRKTQGLSQQKIADMFNVSRANIGLIVTGERWKYLSQNGAKT
jgi:predicted XRE-type DNA-binding protein